MKRRIRTAICLLLMAAMLITENSVAIMADTVSQEQVSTNEESADPSSSENILPGGEVIVSENEKPVEEVKEKTDEEKTETVSPDNTGITETVTPSENITISEDEAVEESTINGGVVSVSAQTPAPLNADVSLSINVAGLTVSYDGTAKKMPDVTLINIPEADKSKYKVSYNYINPDGGARVTSDTAPSFKNAGKYAVSVNLVSNNALVVLSGNDIVAKTWKNYEFEIKPREVHLYSVSATKEYDGTDLVSHNAAITNEEDRKLISADGIKLEYSFSGSQKIVGSSKNIFYIYKPDEKTLTNYSFIKDYGTLTVVPKKLPEVVRNDLDAPQNPKATIGNDGKISVSWKGVKTYPSYASGTVTNDMKKTRYLVYRYDRSTASFNLISIDDHSGEPKYVTGTSFKDESLKLDGNYIYKIETHGVDYNGKYGAGAPAYVIANPRAYSVRPYGEYTGLMFEFSDVGADAYIIERTYTYKDPYTNRNEKSVSELRIERKNLEQGTFQGSGAKYETATMVFKDSGPFISGTANKGYTYNYRVKTASMKLSDGKTNTEIDETVYSNKLSGKTAAESVEIVSVSSNAYNTAYVKWKATDKVSKNCAYPKDSWFAIYRSTNKTTGYGKVLTIRASSIEDVIASGRLKYDEKEKTYEYYFNNLNPEITYYYKVQLVYKTDYVDNNGNNKTMTTTSALSEPKGITPRLDDIKEFKVFSSTTGGVSVSIDAVDGANAYMIYYVKLTDYADTSSVDATSRATIENAFKQAYANAKVKDAIKVQKKRIGGNINKDTGYVNATVTGLKHGSTYAFYANPIRGQEHLTDKMSPEKVIYGSQMVKAGAPTVTSSIDSLTQITFKWTKVSGATGYLVKYYNDAKTKSWGFYVESNSVDKELRSMYNNRKVVIKNVEPGVRYTCEVTPYRKDKETTTEKDKDGGVGLRGDTGSATEMGRPFEPTKVEASFYETAYLRNHVSADAVVTWKDNSKNNGQSNKIKYMLTRRLYSYNTKTKKYDIQVGSDEVLIDMKTNKKVYKYESDAAYRIPYNTVAEYAVAAVYYNPDDKTVGQNHDGYVQGVEGKVRYMNPTSMKFTASSYKVDTNGKTDTDLEFGPKKPDKTTINGAVDYRFEVEQYNSSDKKYYLLSNSSSVANTYLYMNGDDIRARDQKIPDKYRIYLVAFSKNDPSVQTARARVKINKSESKKDSGSSDDNDGGGLVVMLDPGHGGSDSGATSGGATEKDLNLQYAKKVKEELESRGAKVYMTRSDDSYISLTDRTQKAKDKGCNLFISIHMNSGGGSGTEVYYSVDSKCARKKLASKLAENISEALSIHNRGAKTRTGNNGDYYSVIRTSASHGIPGLIVEHGFIDNSSDRWSLQNNMSKAASEEARTIVKYWDQN